MGQYLTIGQMMLPAFNIIIIYIDLISKLFVYVDVCVFC